MLIAALTALEADGLRGIPWTWDMGLDPETGQAVRDGEVVDVDSNDSREVREGDLRTRLAVTARTV